MAVEVIFYSLVRKPPARGGKAIVAMAAGKESRGRKWYRLEAFPGCVYHFPDGCNYDSVVDWYYDNAPAHGWSWVAFSLGGELFDLGNDEALRGVVNGYEALKNAMSCHSRGCRGWVVFIASDEV